MRGRRYAGAMDLTTVRLEIPEGGNVILGQTHFIKSVEDLYEALVNTVPNLKFGIAFNEASGPCLTRVDGNDNALQALAARNATAIAAGHIFVIALLNGYPINVLGRIQQVPEVCSIFCATANPVEVVVAETDQGRGVLGVIDGFPPKGVETEADARVRHDFLRKIGYKR
jgi:adenosine/AMP kinase